MSHSVARLCVVVLCAAAAVGCRRGAARLRPPKIDPVAAAEAAIKHYDTNSDGAIDSEELKKAPALKRAVRQIDLNDDGEIRVEEIADRIRQWQASKLGRRVLSCTVLKGGAPVNGARITFEPEEFLGDRMVTATGVTDEYGMASVSVPISPGEGPGLPPGFYLVRITKGEDIPAKYNTETILGEEVAKDAEAMIAGGPTYNVD